MPKKPQQQQQKPRTESVTYFHILIIWIYKHKSTYRPLPPLLLHKKAQMNTDQDSYVKIFYPNTDVYFPPSLFFSPSENNGQTFNSHNSAQITSNNDSQHYRR